MSLFRSKLIISKDRLQKLGSKGSDIGCFQRIFNKIASRYGIHVTETEIYDEETRSAVSHFQQLDLNVLNTDGFVGPETAKRLRIKLLGE